MNIISELVLVESKSARDEQLSSRTHEQAEDCLAKAKALIHFVMYQGNKIATTEQVAEFYEVPEANIRQLTKNHKDEFESDGLKVLRGKALKDARDTGSLASADLRASQVSAWTPRATLRLGMLLRDSGVAKSVRTALLDVTEESGEKSERIRELELQLAISQANATTTANQLRLVEKTESLAAFHGVPTALILLGRSDEVAEVEKQVLEVVDERHKVRFNGQTTAQIAEYVKKRHGVRLKNGGCVKRILKQHEKDSLIAHVPRVVIGEYIPNEHLQEVYKILTHGDRQMLIGE